jgi:double-stranded uracil-DNA glycosylase
VRTGLTGLPPVVDGGTRVLVLGSMPGELSLHLQQYYAHPRNDFWRIMSELVGFDAREYEVRLAALRTAGIGLWDVLRICDRVGSLDAAIVEDSMKPNDFDALFARCPGIARVFFNGGKAEQVFRRRVLPGLGVPVECRRLPSTSATNAGYSFNAKLQAWRAVVDVG